ncbi:hypothetical protein NKG05_15550 [Oerskovia sp. M15]
MFEEPEANTAALQAIAAPTAFVMGRNMFARGAARGTRPGGAGGARSRRTTHRSSSSRTTRATRSSWPVGRRSRS